MIGYLGRYLGENTSDYIDPKVLPIFRTLWILSDPEDNESFWYIKMLTKFIDEKTPQKEVDWYVARIWNRAYRYFEDSQMKECLFMVTIAMDLLPWSSYEHRRYQFDDMRKRCDSTVDPSVKVDLREETDEDEELGDENEVGEGTDGDEGDLIESILITDSPCDPPAMMVDSGLASGHNDGLLMGECPPQAIAMLAQE